MNRDTKRYLRELRAEIPCGFFRKKKLIQPFLTSLENFLSEAPDASYSDLVDAFGTPKEMAATLSEKISDADIYRYKKTKKIIFAAVIFAVLLLSAWTLWALYDRSIPVTIVQTTIIYD